MTDPKKPAAPVVDAPAYGMNGVGMYGDGLDPVTGGFAHLLIGGKRVDKATILAALAQQPRTEPDGEAVTRFSAGYDTGRRAGLEEAAGWHALKAAHYDRQPHDTFGKGAFHSEAARSIVRLIHPEPPTVSSPLRGHGHDE